MTETNEVQVIEPSALVAITEGEINTQIATARRFPRSIKEFQQKALTLATLNTEIAQHSFYKLKRGGKVIEGPSVRLAEIAVTAWGNLRAGARVISIDEKYITSMGMAHDLEHNVEVRMEVKRRITKRDGTRYDDDMIMVTSNAANAIAFRNACFKIIPYAYVQELYKAVKKAAVGDMKTLGTRRKQMLKAFADLKVKENKVLAYIGRPSVEDIDLGDLEDLIGVYNAIQDGDTSVGETFGKGDKPKVSAPKAKKAEAREVEPEKKLPDMEPSEFQNAFDDVTNKLYKQGLSESEVANILVKAGYLADHAMAEPKERRPIMALLYNYIEVPCA